MKNGSLQKKRIEKEQVFIYNLRFAGTKSDG